MTRPTQGLRTRAPTHASRTKAARYVSTLAIWGLGNFKATLPPSTSSSAANSLVYRPSEISAFRTNPSIVSPRSGTGITRSSRMAALIYAERAGQRVRAAGAFLAHMVGREAGHAIAAQSVGPGIPDMQQVRDAAAQYEGGERASHSGELGVLATQRIDPAVERADDRRPGALHLHGLGQIAKPGEEAAHRVSAAVRPPFAPPMPS